ncbi:ATP-binding protein [bacterium]|nr:ATP-binding protein [bacterium]
MSQPIIPGKLSRPPRPAGYLPRPRLENLWDDWRRRRLVLVTAGAGFGKTSLLAAVTAACTRPVAWYSLDEMDADPAVFRDHLLAAVSAGESRGGGDDARDLAKTVRVLRDRERGSVLILDDLGVEKENEWVTEKLFQILNRRYQAELPTVIITNCRLEELEPRIYDRLSDDDLCTRCQILAPSYRQRRSSPGAVIS